MGAGVKVGALDLALTKIGWAITRPTLPPWAATIHPRGRGIPRLADGLAQTVNAMRGASLVVLEGYSFQSEHSRAHALGEMGGVVRLGLWQMKPRPLIMVIPPKSLKKFATGNGNADKERMLEAARKRLDYGRHSDDEADALWLLQAALHYYGLPGAVPLPDTQVAVIRSLEWPPGWVGPGEEF